MIRPAKMNLMKISLHESEISDFLSEIPKIPHFQVRNIAEKKSDVREHHHYHHSYAEEILISKDLTQISDKINEIENHLFFLFKELKINPDAVPIPELNERFVLDAKDVNGLIDELLQKSQNSAIRLKNYRNQKKEHKEYIEEYELVSSALKWLEEYQINNKVIKWPQQLTFRLFYAKQQDFINLEILMEHEEIPSVLQFKEISSNTTIFFIISHNSHEMVMNEMITSATVREIDDFDRFLYEDGINYKIIEEDIKFSQGRIEKAVHLIDQMMEDKIKFRGFLEILENIRAYVKLEQQFLTNPQHQIIKLEAFLPDDEVEKVSQRLLKKFDDKIRIEINTIERNISADQNANSKDKQSMPDMKVPTLIKIPAIFRPFQRLVSLYGTTNYQEIDPTPVFAITFSVLFGLMFGDVGHGIVFIILGITLMIMNLADHRATKDNAKYDFGVIFIWLGTMAIIGGLLYGEIFGNEIMVNGHHFALYSSPMHDIVAVLKLAIIVGIIHLSMGWFIAMINYIIKKQTYLAFADPFLKMTLLLGGSYLIFNWGFNINSWFVPPYPGLLAFVPAGIFLIAKPIGKVIFRVKYLQHESLGEMFGEGGVEIAETYLSILSNVASYSRVLALSMAHMGLMLIVSTLVDLGGSNPIMKWTIIITGNAFVIMLEGMMAAIHSLRLQFYEFFGKFYSADGIVYMPLEIKDDYSMIRFLKKETPNFDRR